MMKALLSPAAWGSPLGVGIFLICLGIFIYILSLADKNERKGKK